MAVSPILSALAADLGVSTATAGQLRTVSGGVAGVVAVALLLARRRYGLRDMLTVGLGLLAAGAAGSAVAPAFVLLAAAQLAVGVGLALVLSGALAATVTWADTAQHGRALSWALIGQPAAWIVGLPVMGALGGVDWRLAFLFPLAAAAVSLALVLRRPRDPALPAAPWSWPRGAGGWALSELLAFAGWAGMLVYAGAFFTDGYGVPVGLAGLLLGIGAAAYLPGNFLARRWVARAARGMVLGLAPVMAVTSVVLFVADLPLVPAVAVFALLGFLGGARTIASSALGLRIGAADPLRAMSIRTAAVQGGYLAGAGLGGVGLSVAGWPGLGIILAVLLMVSGVAIAVR